MYTMTPFLEGGRYVCVCTEYVSGSQILAHVRIIWKAC